MKYLRQFCIILLVSALGEGLHILLPLPVPASVYGLVLMLGALASGILKLEQVEEAADFLVEIMPVMFVPAGVGLLEAGSVPSCWWYKGQEICTAEFYDHDPPAFWRSPGTGYRDPDRGRSHCQDKENIK